MCGLFGIISDARINQNDLKILALHARQRGRDSSGIMLYKDQSYHVKRADFDIKNLLSRYKKLTTNIIIGHSRLITNGLFDNQPVVRDQMAVFHNGIIVNDYQVFKNQSIERKFKIDTEAIIAVAIKYLSHSSDLSRLPNEILTKCDGTIAAALALPKLGKICLFSNNGSLYVGEKGSTKYFASESYPLKIIGCKEIKQVLDEGMVLDIPVSNSLEVFDELNRSENLIPTFKNIHSEEAMLLSPQNNIQRCTKCILPHTMPFISFDTNGVCNYCNNYKTRNQPKPIKELSNLLKPYRHKHLPDCIVPFSGGRDSSWALHLIVNELKLKPITFTYDWGMITDLGRRNISRMCARLGVEHIIIADDILKKRQNIAMNLRAWLKSPHLGMVSILTAGDKHFFRHVETIKKQTGISLNLWGVNPLEVTHFKAGFLGVPPVFDGSQVYINDLSKQARYQFLRLKAMFNSLGYFNKSLWDTISGEYYRSISPKTDYYHIFDYWKWDEELCNKTLQEHDWELAPDTNTTWRIGDGTAAFYNYIYYTVAGFSEHDTFRSNQIREGQISRVNALKLVEDENRPRYKNIRWYLDTLNMDFKETITTINKIPRLYGPN